MKSSRLLQLSALVAFAGCTPNVYRADLGAIFVRGKGDIALQNASGSLALGDEQNDLGSDLDLGSKEGSPYLRLEWEGDLHHVRVHGFRIESAGNGTLAGDYGNIPAGTQVSTSLDMTSVGVSYAYEVLGGEDYRIGLGGQLGYYRLDVDARAGLLQESVGTDLLMPMPYAEAEYYLGPFVLGANIGMMSAEISDANGRYVDAELLVRWRPSRNIEVLGGYRALVLDAFGTATDRDFDADLFFDGFFLGGGVRL